MDALRDRLFRTLRVAFRLLPMGDATRDGLRQQLLERFPRIRPRPGRGLAAASGQTRRPLTHSGGRALGHVEHSLAPLPSPLPATLVAFYLPQFHPICENDTWWGRGFTEWRNVSRALPQFEGHAQPRQPGDMGHYDLRNPQVMRDQTQLARDYGIGAFCFYFYWFAGKTLLETPLQQWLHDPSIDFPVCICWANENWSRRWDGRADDLLIAQAHSPEDDLAFIEHISRYLRDPRYLRVDGKPLLLIYRPGLLPDAVATTERWRRWCLDAGIGEICLAYVQSFERPDPRTIGCDVAVEFPPNLSSPPELTAKQQLINPEYRGQVLDWRALADDYAARAMPSSRLFPGVNCGWDNEPRRSGSGRTFLHASPGRYAQWLSDTIHRRLATSPAHDRLVFINAWNEWAEGAVLEPDLRLGHAWLHATRHALLVAPAVRSEVSQRPCVVVHAWDADAFAEILDALSASGLPHRLVITTAPEKRSRMQAMLTERRMPAEMFEFENRGRDILPFFRVAYVLREQGEQIVLKLHTKSSLHRDNGAQWRQELLQALLPPGQTVTIFKSLLEQPEIGIVAPDGHLLSVSEFIGGNADRLDYLIRRSGLPALGSDARFVSGSMFWLRLDAIRPLLDAHLDEWEFESETGQIDGTMAHAIERVLALCADGCLLRTVPVSALCNADPKPPTSNRYAYARPS